MRADTKPRRCQILHVINVCAPVTWQKSEIQRTMAHDAPCMMVQTAVSWCSRSLYKVMCRPYWLVNVSSRMHDRNCRRQSQSAHWQMHGFSRLVICRLGVCVGRTFLLRLLLYALQPRCGLSAAARLPDTRPCWVLPLHAGIVPYVHPCSTGAAAGTLVAGAVLMRAAMGAEAFTEAVCRARRWWAGHCPAGSG